MALYRKKEVLVEAEQFVPPDPSKPGCKLPSGVHQCAHRYYAVDSDGRKQVVQAGNWLVRQDTDDGCLVFPEGQFQRCYDPVVRLEFSEQEVWELGELLGMRGQDSAQALVDEVRKRFQQFESFKKRCAHDNFEVEQALGSAIGCPAYPADWPGSTGLVCTGGHTAVTLAMEVKRQATKQR